MTEERCQDEVCITCSDQLLAVMVEVIAPDGLTAIGVQDGARCEIALDLLTDVKIGDTLLVHGGVALGRRRESGCQEDADG